MVTAHIPSIIGREEGLRQVLISISSQVDWTFVELNGYVRVPDWIRQMRNVQYAIGDNKWGDASKWLHVKDMPGVCVFLDDDLIARQGFVDYLRYGLKKHGGAVSLHGKRYDTLPVQRYRRSYTANLRCLGSVIADTQVHVIGTGCMAFDNSKVVLDWSVMEHKNMADVLFSRFCYTRGIPMTVLKHRAGQFLQYLKPATPTIWQTTGDDKIQTQILNSFLCPSV